MKKQKVEQYNLDVADFEYELYQGDCLEIMDKLIKEGIKVDMILTDPPYGTTACKWDSVIPLDKMWNRIDKLLKNNRSCLLFSTQPYTTKLTSSNIDNFKYCWYWEKTKPNGFQHSKNKPMRAVEEICVFSKAPIGHVSQLGDKRMLYNPQGIVSIGEKVVKNCSHSGNTMGGENGKSSRPNQVGRKYEAFTGFPSDILRYANITGKKCIHPTQKPVELLEYLISTYTNKNEIVLDFTMGSGSTGVACINTNRKFIGIELDEKYFEIARNRIQIVYNKCTKNKRI